MNQFPGKNYFTLPNEIFSLGLGAGEIAVYAYLRCLENPSTYQCWPSYSTIGKAIGRTKNTVMQYVDALSEKGLISTEPTSVQTKSKIKKNGNLRLITLCASYRPRTGCCFTENTITYNQLPKLLPSWGWLKERSRENCIA